MCAKSPTVQPRKLNYLVQGFTLLEVLVALAIIAVALSALLRASGLSAENSGALRDRMRAGWIAENHIVMLRARRAWPDTGQTAGEESGEDGHRWRWEQEVVATPNQDFRKVRFRVLASGARRYVLAELVGFVTRPPTVGADL